MKKLFTYLGYRPERMSTRVFGGGGGGINGREKDSAGN